MGWLPIDEMVKDADALARQFSDGSNPIRDILTADVICHVKALASEVERLRSGLRGIRREFGHESINNGTSTLGLFIDMLVNNDVESAKRLQSETEWR